MLSLHQAARVYALRFNFSVLPLAAHGKTPVVRGGFHSATSDLRQIDEWWSQFPNANIGLVPASAGLLAVDIDKRSSGDETLAALEEAIGPIPHTWTSSTGDGWHLWFRVPTGLTFASRLGPGIDLKHAGGYVCAPPSIHPTGAQYTWDSGRHPSECSPEWLPRAYIELARTKIRTAVTASPLGDAADSFLGEAFRVAGLLGEPLHGGKRIVWCPWNEQHTDGRGAGADSSTVLLAPISKLRIGRFVCMHAHCENRSITDLYAALPVEATIAAAIKFPSEHDVVQRLLKAGGANDWR